MVHNQMYIDYLIKWNVYKRRDIQECWWDVVQRKSDMFKIKAYIAQINWCVYLLEDMPNDNFKCVEVIINKLQKA